MTPALAACAANFQGKFHEMYEIIWNEGFENGRKLSRDHMLKLAAKIGLNTDKLEADMDGKCKSIVRKDMAVMSKFGVRGTPAFYINGRYLSGAQPLPRFKAIVDEELAKYKKRIADGTDPADYYETWVIEKGKDSV